MKDPSTDAEWQEAVDEASFWLHAHAAQCYGLITGADHVNVPRCADILRRGRRRRVFPTPDHIERLTRAYSAPRVNITGGI